MKRCYRQIIQITTILTGVGILVFWILFSSIGGDFNGYWYAAGNFVEGEPFIGPAPWGGEFIYQPIVIVLFIPFAFLSFWVAFGIQTVLNVILACILAVLTIQEIQSRGYELAIYDKYLITGVWIFGGSAAFNHGHGNINYILTLLLVLAFRYDRDGSGSLSGVMAGLAASIKIYPALLGVWYLYRKSTHAITASVVTGLSIISGGLLLFGKKSYNNWVRYNLQERTRLDSFRGGTNPNDEVMSVNRFVSFLFPNSPDIVFSLTPLILTSIVLILIYYFQSEDTDPLISYSLVVLAMIVSIPAYPYYMLFIYYSAITFLYVSKREYVEWLLGIGLVCSGIIFGPEEITVLLNTLGIPGKEPLLMAIELLLSVITIPTLGLILIGTALFDLLYLNEENVASWSK